MKPIITMWSTEPDVAIVSDMKWAVAQLGCYFAWQESFYAVSTEQFTETEAEEALTEYWDRVESNMLLPQNERVTLDKGRWKFMKLGYRVWDGLGTPTETFEEFEDLAEGDYNWDSFEEFEAAKNVKLGEPWISKDNYRRVEKCIL